MAAAWRKSYQRYRSFFLNIYNVYKRRPDLKMFLEIILSLITISAFAAFALRPTALTITQLLEEIETKEETIQRMDTKIANLQIAQTIYNQELGRLALLDQAVPEEPTPEFFIRQIEGLASTRGVSVLGMSIGELVLVGEEQERRRGSDEGEPLPQDAGEVNFSISVQGDYQQLDTFFNDLNNLRRPIKIDNVNFNSAETETGQTLVLVLQGRVPYLRQN
jgi:Tfp pilus assembly protein PilO